jgi:photosystem II stability/assembly factor-like uncharacterized protein
VAGSGRIWQTTDAGVTWQLQNSGGSRADLFDVVFVNRMEGFAVGGGDILRTADGGATWQLTHVSGAGLFGLRGVAFQGADIGIIVGDGGAILRTTTGGL